MVRRQRSLMGGNDANQGNNGQKQQQRPRLQSGQGHVLARGRCRIDNSLLLWWYYFLIPGILRPVVGCTRRLGHTVHGQYADADAACECGRCGGDDLQQLDDAGAVATSGKRLSHF